MEWLIVFVIIIIIIIVYAINSSKQETRSAESILSHKNEWGDEWCKWLIDNKIKADTRLISIMAYLNDLDDEIIVKLLLKKVDIGFNQEMVKLSWGEPANIDQKEITTKKRKERWVYGIPRKNARYLYFQNDIVTKIKT